VIIPGFGGFVINPKSATINKENDKFYPPSREITFNQNLIRNDGLLADGIAAKEEVSYEVAVQQIEEFNKDNEQQLSVGAKVQFRGVGEFTRDTRGVLRFEPNSDANFLRSSFGLSSFHSPAIKRDTVERTIEKKILKALPQEAPVAGTTKSREGVNIVKYWPAAAVILLLIVASTVLVKTGTLDNISINYSDLNPFGDTVESAYDVRVNDTQIETAPEEKDEIDLWLESIPEAPSFKPDEVKIKVIKRYHVIGGCFGVKANVDKLVRRLKRKGFDAQLVGKNRRGLQRVAFGSYETRGEAKKALKEVKHNHMKSAWLYVSKK
jgi:hypothetical protein